MTMHRSNAPPVARLTLLNCESSARAAEHSVIMHCQTGFITTRSRQIVSAADRHRSRKFFEWFNLFCSAATVANKIDVASGGAVQCSTAIIAAPGRRPLQGKTNRHHLRRQQPHSHLRCAQQSQQLQCLHLHLAPRQQRRQQQAQQ